MKIFLLAAGSMIALGLPAQAEVAASSGTALEEVIVTARRTGENLADVPITVNVLSADAISKKGVQNLSDISGLAPNILWETRGGSVRNRVSIRGISSNDNNTGIDPGIGFYVDDVYLSHGIGFNQSLLDVDRIEVLKGPQGTLFGRNTTAGVIAVYTRRPALGDTYGEVSATLGRFDLRQVRGVGNIPISENAALKVSAIYKEREGYARNVVDGERVNGEHHYGGRAQLLYKPSDSFDLLASAEYFRDDAAQNLVECSGGFCTTGTNHDYRLEASAPNSTKRTSWGVSAAANWRRESGAAITSITAYRHLKASEFQDQDGLALDLTHSGFDLPKDWQFTQEVRLATPTEKRLRGVFGAYYLHEYRNSSTPQDFAPLFISLANGGPPPAAGSTVLTLNKQETDSLAAFGQGSFDITPQLIAELGLRYTYDRKSFDFEQRVLGTSLCGRGGLVFCPFPAFSGKESWGAVSATASLSYKVTENLMPFLRYSRGYKSGGWNGSQLSPGTDPTKPYDPEYLDNYEAGVKFETADRRLRINAAAFYIDYSDLQLRFQDPVSFAYTLKNAGDARSKGAEVEVNWAVLPGLVIDASAGLTDTKITRVDPSPVLGVLDGKEFPFAPKENASLTATWDFPLGDTLTGFVSSTLTHRGNMWLDNANTVKSGAHTLVGARIGVEHPDQAWGIYLSAQNLTEVNRLAFFVGNSPVSGQLGVPNAPRTWQVELKARF